MKRITPEVAVRLLKDIGIDVPPIDSQKFSDLQGALQTLYNDNAAHTPQAFAESTRETLEDLRKLIDSALEVPLEFIDVTMADIKEHLYCLEDIREGVYDEYDVSVDAGLLLEVQEDPLEALRDLQEATDEALDMFDPGQQVSLEDLSRELWTVIHFIERCLICGEGID